MVSCNNSTKPFEVVEESFGEVTQIVLKNNETQEYVAIIPEFGATLNQIALRKDEKIFELVDGCSTYKDLLEEGRNTFKGSKLFPFPNRIRDGKYIFDGIEYQLPINFPQENNAIHGLVLTEKFAVVQKNVDSEKASITIQYEFVGDKVGYPFKCLLMEYFELSAKGFSCKTTIKNLDKVSIPIGEGWHPYFKTGSKIDNLILKLPSDSLYLVDDRMIPTLKTEGINGYNNAKVIGTDEFDTGYKINDLDGIAQTEIIDTLQNIKLIIWQESGNNKYNFLQVYTPPSRNTIAIEPMTCLADAFNNKIGLIVLKPNEIISFSFGVRLE